MILLDEIPPFPTWFAALQIDEMYFHAAKSCCENASSAIVNIENAKKTFTGLRNEEAEILERYDGDSWKAGDELETICIQMEGAEYDIGAAYGPYLQSIALTHILCVTAAEAHINLIAKARLSGKIRDNFERISIEGKWLFLPKILGNTTFDQGAEPFQGFSKLIGYRNELVHYRGRKERCDSFEHGMPKFLDRLGLSLTEAWKSIDTVKGIILQMAAMINQKSPHWLREGYEDLPQDIVTNFFDITLEHEK